MGPSPSLAAYLAWARRGPGYATEAARPRGELVWAHATTDARADALCQLAERLAVQRPGLHLLLTTGPDVDPPLAGRGTVIAQSLPADTVPACDAFLAHWMPDLCLWTGGDLRPALLTCAARRGIPLHLIDAEAARLSRTAWQWFPDLPKSLIRRFERIIAGSDEAARQLRRIGAAERQLTISGPFRAGSVALPVNRDDREAVTAALGGRPAWLTAKLRPDELEVVLTAHRDVTRLAHRLLLIVAPAEVADAPEFRTRIAGQGWRVAVWSEAGMPTETTQIVLADTPEQMGLWYSLAAVTLMASSLTEGHDGGDPREPAAHGSAILHGPHTGAHGALYALYREAGAARRVTDARALASAVEELIAPDRSAGMAHAAWDLSSQGAEVTDRIVELVQDTLDAPSAR